MRAIKTKNRTEIAKEPIWKLLIFILGGVILFTSPFWHVDLPKKTDHIIQFEKVLDKSVTDLKNEIQELRLLYDKGGISGDDYIRRSDDLVDKLAIIESKNDKLLSNEIDKGRIVVWKNLRAFSLAFGIRLPYLLFALVISFLINRIDTHDERLKRAFFLFQCFSYGIATYLMIWVFWNNQDYSLKTYRYAFITASFLIGVAISYFVTWRSFKIQRLETIAKNLIRFTFNVEADDNYIRDDKKASYVKKRTLLIKESLENE